MGEKVMNILVSKGEGRKELGRGSRKEREGIIGTPLKMMHNSFNFKLPAIVIETILVADTTKLKG